MKNKENVKIDKEAEAKNLKFQIKIKKNLQKSCLSKQLFAWGPKKVQKSSISNIF
jgi:hypothetical protein